MVGRAMLIAVLIVLGAGVAAAGEKPLFDFRGELPVPGGTVRLETQCLRETEGVRCRAESKGPAGRGFQFEGRLMLWPQPPTPTANPAAPSPDAKPRWF